MRSCAIRCSGRRCAQIPDPHVKACGCGFDWARWGGCRGQPTVNQQWSTASFPGATAGLPSCHPACLVTKHLASRFLPRRTECYSCTSTTKPPSPTSSMHVGERARFFSHACLCSGIGQMDVIVYLQALVEVRVPNEVRVCLPEDKGRPHLSSTAGNSTMHVCYCAVGSKLVPGGSGEGPGPREADRAAPAGGAPGGLAGRRWPVALLRGPLPAPPRPALRGPHRV